MSKPRHITREVPKSRVKFSVWVDESLFKKANDARTLTWVEVTERMMSHIHDGDRNWHDAEKLAVRAKKS